MTLSFSFLINEKSVISNHKVALKISSYISYQTHIIGGFPGGAVVENLPANAGDTGSSPGLGRSHMLWSN